MIYFIADTHFSEERIILYENRPFKNIQEMDQELAGRWNDTVKETDEVFVLGDLGADDREALVLKQLKEKSSLFSSQHFCVSVERINYTPISFDEIIMRVQNNIQGNGQGIYI